MERWVVIVHSTGNENLDPTTLKIKIKQPKQPNSIYDAKLLHTSPWPYRLAGMYPMTSMSQTSVCVWMSSTPT